MFARSSVRLLGLLLLVSLGCGGGSSAPAEMPPLDAADVVDAAKLAEGKKTAALYDQADRHFVGAEEALRPYPLYELIEGTGAFAGKDRAEDRTRRLDRYLKDIEPGLALVRRAAKRPTAYWVDNMTVDYSDDASYIGRVKRAGVALANRARVLAERGKAGAAVRELGLAARVQTHGRQSMTWGTSWLESAAVALAPMIGIADAAAVGELRSSVQAAREGLPSYRRVVHLDHALGRSFLKDVVKDHGEELSNAAFAVAVERWVELEAALASRDPKHLARLRSVDAQDNEELKELRDLYTAMPGKKEAEQLKEKLNDGGELERNARFVAVFIMTAPRVGIVEKVKRYEALLAALEACCDLSDRKRSGGSYPEDFEMPADPFAEQPLGYSQGRGLATVTSVGPDGEAGTKDDLTLTIR